MKYVEIGHAIDAWQLPIEMAGLPLWVMSAIEDGKVEVEPDLTATVPRYTVATGIGRMTLRPGDWLVRSLGGRLTVMSHAAFTQTYREQPEQEPWPPAGAELPDAEAVQDAAGPTTYGDIAGKLCGAVIGAAARRQEQERVRNRRMSQAMDDAAHRTFPGLGEALAKIGRDNDEVETDAALLERLGSDAALWATEFCLRFAGRQVTTADLTGFDFLDVGTMVGWFANAIGAGERQEQQNQRWREVDAIDIARQAAAGAVTAPEGPDGRPLDTSN